MNRLNVKKFGFAMGLTGAIIYAGCMIVLATAGQEGSITFFNSLLHGLDTTSIIRIDVPIWEALIGIVQTFIIAWLTGALIAAFYNVQLKRR
tara:strand:- start:4005 stop:4280 length:276 start_codon:yes stop_codon:yes gene_type:complete